MRRAQSDQLHSIPLHSATDQMGLEGPYLEELGLRVELRQLFLWPEGIFADFGGLGSKPKTTPEHSHVREMAKLGICTV